MKIVFRVDASILIGSGHVMRCLTLADELCNAGAKVSFVTRKHEANLNGVIRDKGFQVFELPVTKQTNLCDGVRCDYAQWLCVSQQVDARETIYALGGIRPEWLIVDHYAIDQEWEQLVSSHVNRIMVIDDLANRKHACDMLLDQNYVIGMDERYMGLVPVSCTTLLGPGYAMLRKEFIKARKTLKERDGSVDRVFVFFGGVDSANMTTKALQALSATEFSHIHVDVVIGVANPNRDELAGLAKLRDETSLHVQVENIAELMAQADLALCAGGSSTWERLYLGLPSLVVTIADNQVPFTRDLHEKGLLRCLGTVQEVGIKEIRSSMQLAMSQVEHNCRESKKGLNLVGGRGAERVGKLMMTGPEENSLTVRKALECDSELFWYWVNDPDVRKSAFHSEPIPWETHQRWFAGKIHDHEASIYVVESENGPVGQVRFEGQGEHYIVDYSVVRQFRGLGLSKKMLSVALQAFQEERVSGKIIAEVKNENIPSNKVFERLGFEEDVTHTHTGIRRFLLQFSLTEHRG
jgi:UDP-2,4-diacetamido-2,4,6-trideoxy-beta-L-altropyranose hydrolase